MGAPLKPVPNVLKIVIGGSQSGRIWANVLHFRYSGGPPTNGDCSSLAAQITIKWNTNMAPECPSPIVLTKVTVTDLTSPTAGGGEATANYAGTRGDDVIGANTAMLVTYPLQLRYKGGHPRSYLLVGGNADNLDGDQWHTAFADEVYTHWTAFLNSIVSSTSGTTTIAGMVAVRYHGQFLPNGGPPHFYLDNPLVGDLIIDQLQTQIQMASQRRRIGRVRK